MSSEVYSDRIRVCLEKEFGCVPRSAKSANQHLDMFTRFEYFVNNLEVAKSCVTSCRICSKKVVDFVRLLNITV